MRMGVSAAVAGFRGWRGPCVGDSDDYLIARLRAGDDDAFEAIYDRYARGVLAFCVHMLGSREAAEDALQLTFVSAFRALRGGESNISLRPWLYTIARNRCLSELRTRRDAVDAEGAAVDRLFLEGVADQVQRREDLREMLEDMRRLPADQRAALVLFELGDHSHKEIAAVLGVRTEKVKALVFQAREALMRGRRARERPCAEIRERLATLEGRVLPSSMTRAHVDRCPSCTAFESELRRQHAVLALTLPVVLASELKASVLGSALHGGAVAAGGATAAGGAGGAGAGGAGAVAAGGAGGAGAGGAGAGGAGAVAAGGATAGGAGAVAAGGATAAGGAGAVAAGGATAAGSVAAGTGAASTGLIAGAPSVAAVATGLTAVGADYAAPVGVGGLGATGVLAKILTAAAIATGGAGAIHATSHGPHPLPAPAAALQVPTPPANPATALAITSTPATAATPAATPSAPTTAATPAATPSAPTTATTTARAATPGTTATTTTTTPAATPGTTATTTTTTPAATSSTDSTDTAAPSVPAMSTSPDVPAATKPVPDPSTAQATAHAIAPTATTGGN
jgi:RNA polymerase sigma factor (sigma-70 family)